MKEGGKGKEREEGEPPVSHTTEQDVVMCGTFAGTFALQRQHQIDTVTTPLYQLVSADRQME